MQINYFCILDLLQIGKGQVGNCCIVFWILKQSVHRNSDSKWLVEMTIPFLRYNYICTVNISDIYIYIRELVDSLCRDGAKVQYISMCVHAVIYRRISSSDTFTLLLSSLHFPTNSLLTVDLNNT